MKLKWEAPVSKRNEKIIYHGFREMQALFGFFFGFFPVFCLRAEKVEKTLSPDPCLRPRSEAGGFQFKVSRLSGGIAHSPCSNQA
jgi:hypothetical protein